MTHELKALVTLLTDPSARLLVVTGAGISLASGIPTFRGSDEGAVWSNDVMENATLRHFQQNPVHAWQWYLDRFDKCWDATPNSAHHALVELATKVHTDVVTQNIDGLHHQAGQPGLIEIHGAARFLRCTRQSCDGGGGREDRLVPFGAQFNRFKYTGQYNHLARCPKCRKLFRPHVLWFDEFYTGHKAYQYEQALGLAAAATVLLVVGTSFSVGFMDAIVEQSVANDVALHIVDPNVTMKTMTFAWAGYHIEKAEVFLPALVAAL